MKQLWFCILISFFCLTTLATADKPNKNRVSLLLGHSFAADTEAQTLELGVHNTKGKDFIYIPYVGLFLQNMSIQSDEFDVVIADEKIKGAAMGIRAGVAVPAQVFDQQLSFFASLAYAQCVVQNDPWFGQSEDAIDDQSMHQANLGARLYTHKFILSYDFIFTDLSYFESAQFVQLGVFF